MTDFMKSNSQLDEAIASADNFEGMREKILQTLVAQGQVVRSRTDAYDVRVIRKPEPTSEVPVPANGFRYEKEVRFHPESGKRALIIRANTMEDLRDLENQIVGQ